MNKATIDIIFRHYVRTEIQVGEGSLLESFITGDFPKKYPGEAEKLAYRWLERKITEFCPKENQNLRIMIREAIDSVCRKLSIKKEDIREEITMIMTTLTGY